MKRYRNKLTPAHRDILTLLSGRGLENHAPDWPEILRIADDNRVKPLIYNSVRSLRLDVPEEFLLPLAKAYASTFAKNCEILIALDEMGCLLSRYGIEAVPIKGASLIQRVYKDPGLRPLWDIDVWIDGDKAHLANRILLEAGFVNQWDKPETMQLRKDTYAAPPFCKRLNAEIDPQIGRWNIRPHLPPLLLPRGSGIKFEIHHHLAWDPSILSHQMTCGIWNRRKPVAEKKGLAFVSEKDELIILVAHLLSHIKNYNHNLLHHMDIALAWQKEAWRLGIENTANSEVKELVNLSVAALSPPDGASARPARIDSSGNLLFCGIKPGIVEKNEWLLHRLVKIWQVYGFFKLVRYIAEWVVPSPADFRYLSGKRKGSLLFYYFHRIFKRILSM